MKTQSFYSVVISVAAGILGGLFLPSIMLKIAWIGDTFINMLKLICLPLVFCALVSAIGTMKSFVNLKKIGAYTLAYVICCVSIATFIGLLFINFFQPGLIVDPQLITSANYHLHQPTSSFTFISFIQNMFPDNIIAAASKFQIMPVVVFAVIFAIGCIATGNKAEPAIAFFVALREIFIKLIAWLMLLTPIGLFSLLGAAVAKTSQNNFIATSIKGIIIFIAIFFVVLLLQILWQGIFVLLITHQKVKSLAKATGPALMTAFATSSSMATLPVAMLSAQELKLNSKVIRFVLPLATTINLSGTAMYEAIAAVFFIQILGLPLSFIDQISIFIMAIIAGMGATGIPEGGLITMVSVLNAVNVPVNAIGLLLPFDRILDRARTTVNVWSDLMCVTIVNHFISKKISSNEYESNLTIRQDNVNI